MSLASVKQVSPYPQYRAPAEPNAVVVEPALEELDGYASRRHVFDGGTHLEFCGKSLAEAREHARAEIVKLAVEHTTRYSDVADIDDAQIAQRAIVLSGHQPELFHPGVWFKNYLLGRFAQRSGSLSINFLVDNDLCRSTAIRVPTRDSDGGLRVVQVPFDTARSPIPWELAQNRSRDTWDRFPVSIRDTLPDAAEDLLVDPLWRVATRSLERSGNLGLALAEGRHVIEREAGLDTLEVPLSRMVSTRAFARFSIHLLADLPRFQLIYNLQRDRYRTAHKIRNEAHPVPALQHDGDWLEAPWWVYRPIDPHRRALWVRMESDSLILSDRSGWQVELEGRLDCDNAASQWLDILADGVCLRPRALLTTMYLRLFVGDLFIHGIGGGKYDQLTNEIIRDFFGLEPPPMGVASATIPLPQHEFWVSPSCAELERQLREAKQELWELQHHADKYLSRRLEQQPGDDVSVETRREIESLIARKEQLLGTIPPRGEKSAWHQAMRDVQERLRTLADGQAGNIEQRIQELSDRLQQARIATSREYAFCLFGRRFLVGKLKELAGLDQDY